MTDKIFFDTDCLSAFLWVRNENLLVKLYGSRIVLPEQVYGEICLQSVECYRVIPLQNIYQIIKACDTL